MNKSFHSSNQNLDFAKGNGLLPVIVQDHKSKEVLMLAYTNEEAFKLTKSTGYAHFWSRSRNKLWRKGETSGNIQKIKKILIDCDYDAILFLVEQKGNVCHTGAKTCFHHHVQNP